MWSAALVTPEYRDLVSVLKVEWQTDCFETDWNLVAARLYEHICLEPRKSQD